jgi:hypothetical protein
MSSLHPSPNICGFDLFTPTSTIRLIKKIMKQIIFDFLYLGMDGVQCKDMFFLYKIRMTCSKSSNSNWIDGLLI